MCITVPLNLKYPTSSGTHLYQHLVVQSLTLPTLLGGFIYEVPKKSTHTLQCYFFSSSPQSTPVTTTVGVGLAPQTIWTLTCCATQFTVFPPASTETFLAFTISPPLKRIDPGPTTSDAAISVVGCVWIGIISSPIGESSSWMFVETSCKSWA